MLRRGGESSRMPCKSTFVLDAGDEVEIRTAGGGGYGTSAVRKRSEVLREVENGLLTSEQALEDYGLRVKTHLK